MSRSIELSDEDYARLEQAAELERITPAEWIARRIPVCGEAEAQPSPNGKPEGTAVDILTERAGRIASAPNQAGAEVVYATMAERLAGRIGRIGSGGTEILSEQSAEPTRDTVEDAPRAEQGGGNGTGTAKPATMAERLAGRIGTLSGSGGLPSSDDVAKSFAEYLEAKQRAGTL